MRHQEHSELVVPAGLARLFLKTLVVRSIMSEVGLHSLSVCLLLYFLRLLGCSVFAGGFKSRILHERRLRIGLLVVEDGPVC